MIERAIDLMEEQGMVLEPWQAMAFRAVMAADDSSVITRGIRTHDVSIESPDCICSDCSLGTTVVPKEMVGVNVNSVTNFLDWLRSKSVGLHCYPPNGDAYPLVGWQANELVEQFVSRFDYHSDTC